MVSLNPHKGRLLVAEPSILNDQSFNRSIIFITKNDTDEGTIGFIVNKPTNFVLSDLLPDIDCDFKVYTGGPVSSENLYFIHKIPHLIPNSIEVSKGIYWAGDFEMIVSLLNEKKINQDDIRFFLGYSGWEENQLKDELDIDSWVVVENNYANILNMDASEAWKKQLIEFGGKYQIWANAPKNPSLN